MPPSAVLFSGGLDSAVLLALELREFGRVQPIHVRAGLAWEDAEARAIARLLASPPFERGAAPLISLGLDMRDVYSPTHWAVVGRPPAYDTPDEDVYLEGRNIVLIAKAAVLCARQRLERLALGPLLGNPFPDATPEFFETMARAMSLGLARPFTVATPLAHLHKEGVIALGVELGVPLELTLSCMNPVVGAQNPVDARVGAQRAVPLHCGQCSKCRERHDGFAAAGLADSTRYAAPTPRA